MSASRTTYRRAFGAELACLLLTSASGSTGSSGTINLFGELASSELTAKSVAYQWAYVPSLTVIPQARIAQGGLNATTGVVTLEASLDSVVPSGAEVELWTLLPGDGAHHAHLGGRSANGLVSGALDHLYVLDDSASVSLAYGQRDYSLATWAALLDRANRLVDVRVANSTGNTTDSTFHTWEVRETPSGPTLHVREPYAFASGSYQATLVIERPASTWVKVGGVWTDRLGSTRGLTAESDEAAPAVNDVVAVMTWLLYRMLARRNQGQARATYEALAADQLAVCRRIRGFEVGNEQPTQPAAVGAA